MPIQKPTALSVADLNSPQYLHLRYNIIVPQQCKEQTKSIEDQDRMKQVDDFKPQYCLGFCTKSACVLNQSCSCPYNIQSLHTHCSHTECVAISLFVASN